MRRGREGKWLVRGGVGCTVLSSCFSVFLSDFSDFLSGSFSVFSLVFLRFSVLIFFPLVTFLHMHLLPNFDKLDKIP
jgi:hypothetical protein